MMMMMMIYPWIFLWILFKIIVPFSGVIYLLFLWNDTTATRYPFKRWIPIISISNSGRPIDRTSWATTLPVNLATGAFLSWVHPGKFIEVAIVKFQSGLHNHLDLWLHNHLDFYDVNDGKICIPCTYTVYIIYIIVYTYVYPILQFECFAEKSNLHWVNSDVCPSLGCPKHPPVHHQQRSVLLPSVVSKGCRLLIFSSANCKSTPAQAIHSVSLSTAANSHAKQATFAIPQKKSPPKSMEKKSPKNHYIDVVGFNAYTLWNLT